MHYNNIYKKMEKNNKKKISDKTPLSSSNRAIKVSIIKCIDKQRTRRQQITDQQTSQSSETESHIHSKRRKWNEEHD